MDFKESGRDGPPPEQPDPKMDYENLTPEQQARVTKIVNTSIEGGPVSVTEAVRVVLAEDKEKNAGEK